MRYTEDLNIEQMTVLFSGVLAVLCIILIVFIAIIFCGYSFSILSELYMDKKYKNFEHQKGYELGYENGYKDGLKLANELIGKFMNEHQETMDRLLNNNGDEL